ncbi:PAS domain-containing sensor histidine kinase [Egbenema bharatensis]|uniref:PAS domain-containing sensor histidine kinase n=1 Tax=Egbenema bharatensis TaxID=3463334 RepID=UPI003A84F1F4
MASTPFPTDQINLLDKILAASTDHIYIFDRAGRYLYASPTGLAVLGLQAEEMQGKTWRELNFPAEVMERHDAQRESVFQTGIPITGETYFPTVQGLRYYEYVLSPVLENGGQIDAVSSLVRDITQRKQSEAALRQLTEALEARVTARTEELMTLNQLLQEEIAERQKVEQALQESEMRFRALIEAIFEGIIVQENGQILDANPGFAVMFGYSLEDVIGKSAVDFLTPESLELVLHHTAIHYESPYEVTGIKQDGTRIYLEVVGKQSLYQGRSVRVSALRDITERKQAEQALRESQKQVQRQLAEIETIYQSAPIGLNVLDTELRFVRINQRLAEINGLPVEAHIGRSVREVLPDLADTAEQLLRPILETGTPLLKVEITGETPAQPGVQRVWLESFLPIKDGDRIIGINTVCEEITERKQAEIALREKEQQLQQLSDSMPQMVWISNAQGETEYVNRQWLEYSGLTLEQSCDAQKLAEFHHPDEVQTVFEQWAIARAAQQPFEIEARLRRAADGVYRWFLMRTVPVLDDQGQVLRWYGTSTDIHDRKQAEQALRHSEQQLQIALQAAKAGAWIWELETQRLYWSEECYRVFGLEPGSVEPSYEKAMSQLHPDDREWVERETAEAIAQGKNTNMEYRILRTDGTVRWVTEIGQMFFDESNQPDRMAGIVIDTTERKQIEAELRQREELYRALAHNFPNGAVHIFDHDLRYLLSDGTEMRKVGLSQEQLEGHLLWDVLPPETSAVLEPLYRAALAGEPTCTELSFANQIYQLYTLPLRDETGEIFAGLAMTQNITLLKQAEQTLRTARDELERRTQELEEANRLLTQREREFRTLVENTPDVITRHDRQYRYLYVNPASIRVTGIAPQFLLGKKPSELGYPQAMTRLWEDSLENVFVTGEMRIDEFTVTSRNEPKSYQVYFVPEREAGYSIASVIAIARDITQLRQAEASARQLAEELRRSNQELEQFAYVASHDLQEPLRAVASFTQLLANEYKEQLDDDAEMYIEFIVDGATRMQQLIRDLLAYSRVGRYELRLQAVDCNVILERVKKDLQVVISEHQATITADPLPTLTADPNQMANLLQNLISNSLKYRSEADPRIHISARSYTVEATSDLSDPGSSRLTIEPVDPEVWLFSVQDNGIGIEPQYAKRIFGIFQRLHASDEYSGTGLGLAICQKIIERHQGRIWVESQLGQGATFFFTIPRAMKDSR